MRFTLLQVLIAGFGRRGHAVGDIPGVRFKVVKALREKESQKHLAKVFP